MTDFVTAKERLSSPLSRWVNENAKSAILLVVMFTSVLFIITQPGGLI